MTLKLPCTPGSPSQMVVRAGSKELNLPKLISNYPAHPVPSVKWWFEKVRKSCTTPNSCQTTLYTPFPQSNGGSRRFEGVEPFGTNLNLSQTTLYTQFPQSNGGSRRFERVEPSQTDVILPCTPGSLEQVRRG